MSEAERATNEISHPTVTAGAVAGVGSERFNAHETRVASENSNTVSPGSIKPRTLTANSKSWTSVASTANSDAGLVPNPTVRSGTKAVAWRVEFTSNPTGTRKRAKQRNTNSGAHRASSRPSSVSPIKTNKHLLSSSSDAPKARRTHLPDSFAAAARRGHKKNALGKATLEPTSTSKADYPSKKNLTGSSERASDFPALPTSSTRRKNLPDLAKKKHQDAEERGRKLLLMLSSTNVEDLVDDDFKDSTESGEKLHGADVSAPIVDAGTNVEAGKSGKATLGIGNKLKAGISNKKGSWADAADEEDDAEEARLQEEQFTAEAAEKAKKRLKLWRTLFKNVNRSADELYYLCEFESDSDHARDATELMFNWMNDFQSLFDRLVSQQGEDPSSSMVVGNNKVESLNSDAAKRTVPTSTTSNIDGEKSSSSAEALKLRPSNLRRASRESVAWEIKTSSPQNLDRSNSVVSALQNISPPRSRKQPSSVREKSQPPKDQQEKRNQKVIHIEDFEASCSTAQAPLTLSLSVEQHQTPKLWGDMMMQRDDQSVECSNPTSGGNNGAFDALESSGQSSGSGTTDGNQSLSASRDSDYFSRMQLEADSERIDALLNKSATAGALVDTTSRGEILNAGELMAASLESDGQPTGSPNKSPQSRSRLSSAPSSPSRAEAQKVSGAAGHRSSSNNGHLSHNQHEKTRQRQLQRELHAKLMSPERRKPSPSETKQRLKQKQSTAEINRRRLDSARMARLRKSTERVRDANERRQQKLAKQQRGMIARLNDSEARRRSHLREKAQRAEQQNLKVDEVAFINSLQSQSRKLVLNERLEKGRQRRAENLGAKVARQRDHHAKVQGARGAVQAKVDEESKRTKEKLDKRAQAAKARRQEELKKRLDAATRKDVAERVQKNKEEQERKRQGVQERRKERMWHKVGRASNRKVKFTVRDDAGPSAGESLDEMYGSDQGESLVSGVNIMPCLVSNNKGSPRLLSGSESVGKAGNWSSPPTSPVRNESPRHSTSIGKHGHRKSVAKGNPFFLSAAESDGMTTDGNTDGEASPLSHSRCPPHQQESKKFDLNLEKGKGRSTQQSPRKQFQSAIASGGTVELASEIYDRASEQGKSIPRNKESDPHAINWNKNRGKSRKISQKKKKKKNNKKKKKKKNSGDAADAKIMNNGPTSTNYEGKDTGSPSRGAPAVQSKTKNMKKRMRKVREKIKKLPWVDLNIDEDSDAGDDDADNYDDLSLNSTGVVQLGIGCYSEGAVEAMKKARPKLYQLYTDLVLHADKTPSDSVVDDRNAVMIAAAQASGYFEKDSRVLGVLLAELNWRLYQHTNEGECNNKAALDRRPALGTNEENGWHRLVRDHGADILIRFAFADICLDVKPSMNARVTNSARVGTAGTVDDDAKRRIHAKQRKHQLLALDILEILVQHSSAVCFALCSSSCILSIVSRTITSLGLCTKALAAWNTARRINSSTGNSSTIVSSMSSAASSSIFQSNLSNLGNVAESSENIDHEYFFCKQATAVIHMVTIILGYVLPKSADHFRDSMFTWPSNFGGLFVQYTACAGLWDSISELLRKCAASKYGLLAQPHIQLMQRSMNFIDIAMLVFYTEAEKRNRSEGFTSNFKDVGSQPGKTKRSDQEYMPNMVPIPLSLKQAIIDTCVHDMLHLVEALAETEKVRAKYGGGASTGKSVKRGSHELNGESSALAQFNRHGASPIPFGRTTAQAQKIMLTIAEHNINVFQEALGAPGIKNEVYHVFSFLLEYCNKGSKISSSPSRSGLSTNSSSNRDIDKAVQLKMLLDNTIVLMGYYARGSPEGQQSLHWGNHPTPLQQLCNLPFRYFSVTAAKAVLFPTLIAICHNDRRNTSVVQEECSIDMLSEFIRSKIVDFKKMDAGLDQRKVSEKENNRILGPKGSTHKSYLSDTALGSVTDLSNSDFSLRIPASSWEDALHFFDAS